MAASTKFVASTLTVLALVVHADAKMVAYWPFDEGRGSLARDRSGNGNDGQLTTAATWSNGKFGKCLDLGAPDNGAWVTIPAARNGAFNSIVASQSATISFWMNLQGKRPSRSAAVFCWDGGNSGADAVAGRQLCANAPWIDSQIYFDTGGCCDSSNRIRVAMPASMMNGWVHLAFVRDQQDTRLYINGELVVASLPQAITSPVNFIRRARIGSNNENEGPPQLGSHVGLIDDFAVWDEALPDKRLAAIARGGPLAAFPRTTSVRAVETPKKYDDFLNNCLRYGGGMVVLLYATLLLRNWLGKAR